MGDDRVRLTLDEVRELAVRALQANGCDAPNAAAVARTVAAAERDGALDVMAVLAGSAGDRG